VQPRRPIQLLRCVRRCYLTLRRTGTLAALLFITTHMLPENPLMSLSYMTAHHGRHSHYHPTTSAARPPPSADWRRRGRACLGRRGWPWLPCRPFCDCPAAARFSEQHAAARCRRDFKYVEEGFYAARDPPPLLLSVADLLDAPCVYSGGRDASGAAARNASSSSSSSSSSSPSASSSSSWTAEPPFVGARGWRGREDAERKTWRMRVWGVAWGSWQVLLRLWEVGSCWLRAGWEEADEQFKAATCWVEAATRPWWRVFVYVQVLLVVAKAFYSF